MDTFRRTPYFIILRNLRNVIVRNNYRHPIRDSDVQIGRTGTLPIRKRCGNYGRRRLYPNDIQYYMDSYRMVGNRSVPSIYGYSVRHHHYRYSIRESTLAPPQNEFPPLRFRQNNVAENKADQYFHFNLPVTCWGRSLEMGNPANTMVKEIAALSSSAASLSPEEIHQKCRELTEQAKVVNTDVADYVENILIDRSKKIADSGDCRTFLFSA